MSINHKGATDQTFLKDIGKANFYLPCYMYITMKMNDEMNNYTSWAETNNIEVVH